MAMFHMHGLRGLGTGEEALPASNINVPTFDRVAQLNYNFHSPPDTRVVADTTADNGIGDPPVRDHVIEPDYKDFFPLPKDYVKQPSEPAKPAPEKAVPSAEPDAPPFSLGAWLSADSFLCSTPAPREDGRWEADPHCAFTNQTLLLIAGAAAIGAYMYYKRKS